jgi:hypothetical protein
LSTFIRNAKTVMTEWHGGGNSVEVD